MKMVGNDWENRLKGPNSSKSLPNCPKMSEVVPKCPKMPTSDALLSVNCSTKTWPKYPENSDFNFAFWGVWLWNSITAKPIVEFLYGYQKVSHSDKLLWYKFRAGDRWSPDLPKLSQVSQRKKGKLALISKSQKIDTINIFFFLNQSIEGQQSTNVSRYTSY